MSGVGEYRGDPTESITRVGDLPQSILVSCQRSFRRQDCPQCRHSSFRDRTFTRALHDLGDVFKGRPRDLQLTYSQHYCTFCRSYFKADTEDLAPRGSQYTWRVIGLAVRLVVEDGLPYRAASWHLWRDHRVFVPFATIQNWTEASGEKRCRVRRPG